MILDSGRVKVIPPQIAWLSAPFVSSAPWAVSLRRALLTTSVFWVLCLVIAYAVGMAFPDRVEAWHAFPNSPLWDPLIRWDAAWYQSIVNDGYFYIPGQASNVAFFPLYPLVLRTGKLIFGHIYITSYVLNFLFTATAAWGLHRLSWQLQGDVKAADRALLYLFSFPSAFFLFAPYTESMYLMIAVGAVLAGSRRAWFIAGLLGMLASATRVVGISIWGVLGLMWMQDQGWYLLRVHQAQNWRNLFAGLRTNWQGLAAICLSPLGLVAYILHLQVQVGHPLAFVLVQTSPDWGRSFRGFWRILYGSIENFIRQPWLKGVELQQLVGVVDVGLSLLSLGTAVAVWRRFGAPYALLVIVGVLIPLSTSTASMSRYCLTLFPLFMLWGLWAERRPWADGLLRYLLPGLQIFLLTLYVNWYFAG